jgi:hypothetical protein
MKKYILLLSAFIITIAVTSCKKEKDKENNNDEIAAHAEDESQFSSELDGMLNETNAAIESNGSFSGRFQSLQEIICDATAVYDPNSNPRTITITYSGSNCNGVRTRTGAIVISMEQGVQWKNPGAAVTVSFQNVKITRLRDNKSVTINGSQTYTNVSGGLLINLPVLNSITHRISSSDLSISFNDGTQRSWQVDKQREFTYNSGVVITTTGLHTEGNITGVAEWGTNRFGSTFTTAITTPLVIRQDCSFRLTGGAVEHKTNLFTGTATFGLNAAGDPSTCPGTGAYYFKVTWTGPNGNSYTTILPY